MTVWEHLVANSTLEEGEGDAWDHLTHPSGDGGSCEPYFVPIQDIECDLSSNVMSLDLNKTKLTCDIKTATMTGNIDIIRSSLDIDNSIEGDIKCP